MKCLTTSQPDFETHFDALLSLRQQSHDEIAKPVRDIISAVRSRGDDALQSYTRQFDHFDLHQDAIRVSEEEIASHASKVTPELYEALRLACTRIKAFHQTQLPQSQSYRDAVGATLGMRWTPLDAVGIYVPGGSAAYPSSVLMNALPARVAGVERIAMCVPCPGGELNPSVMAAAKLCNVTEIYRIGGAQAIAAFAYGTASIPAVDRIVGPGNAYVAEAKRQVFGQTGIDSIAGPSEVVVLADDHNNPRHVALDLLAQAEHDTLAQAILITTSAGFAERVRSAIKQELLSLNRSEIAQKSLNTYGATIVVRRWEEATDLVNKLAPEHLEIMTEDPESLMQNIRHAGAIFLGRFCPEAIGDYVGGPNHVLPTNGTARFASGLSVFDFLKRTTTIALDAQGLRAIGQAGVTIARAEGLDAHARSLSIRLEELNEN